jgi:hypothetical protein
MAEAAEIINSTMDSSRLSSGSHVIRGSHAIGDIQGMRLYIQNIPDDKIRQDANRNLSKLLEEQRAKAESRNEAFNHNFVAYNYNQSSFQLLTREEADQYLQGNNQEESNTAEVVAGTAAAGAGLSLVDRNFLKHNPVANTIPGDASAQPESPLSLTLSAEEIENGAGQEYYAYWAEAKNDGIAAFDPSIFKKPLSEDALITNESFQNAAEILYNNDRDEGDPTWAEHALAQGWSNERAAEELGQWGHDHMHDFNYDTFSGIGVARDSKNGGRDVQLATLYMMQAYDHKSVTLGSFGSAAWTAVTDPVNVGFLLLGIAGAAFTGGGSLIAAGTGVAARQTAGMAARKAAMALIGNSIKGNIIRGAAMGGVEALADDYFVRFGAEKDGFRALGKEEQAEYTLQRGATNTALGVVMGGGMTALPHATKKAVDSYVTRRNNREIAKVWDEAHIENVRFDADKSPRTWDEAIAENARFDENKMWDDALAENAQFNDREAAQVWDEAIAENARFDENKMWDEALEENARFDARNAPDDNVVRGRFNNAATGPANAPSSAQSHQSVPQEILDAVARGDAVEYTDPNTSFKVGQTNGGTSQGAPQQSAATQPSSGGQQTSGTNNNANVQQTSGARQNPSATNGNRNTPTSQVPPTNVESHNKFIAHLEDAKAPTTESLPQFDPKIDKVKLAAHLNLLNWHPTASMRARSFGVTRPVIKAIDQQFIKSELAVNIQEMNKRVLETVAPSSKSSENAVDIINEFADKNAKQLAEMKVYLQTLNRHVNDTYKKQNPGKDKYDDSINDKVGWKSDLTTAQRKELQKYISDMEDMVEDLSKGTSGSQGQEILSNAQKVQNGEFSYEDITESVTGLSKSHTIANNVEVRHTGYLPGSQESNGGKSFKAGSEKKSERKGQKAPESWIRHLERSIDLAAYSTHSPLLNGPITNTFVVKNNLEAAWQNRVQAFANRKDDGSLDIDFKGTVRAKNTFLAEIMAFIQGGYGHEAVLSMQQLANLSHAPGGSHIRPFPDIEAFRDAVAELKIKPNENELFYLNKLEEIIKKDKDFAIGGEDATQTGFGPRFIEDNRLNRHRAERAINFWEEALRWAGPDNEKWWSLGHSIAKPGNVDFTHKFTYYRNKPFQYFAGAHTVEPGTKNQWGVETKDFSPKSRNIQWIDKEGGESPFSVPRRLLVRVGSVGLVDDLQWSIKPAKLTTMGNIALGGGIVWGVGEGLDHSGIYEQDWISTAGDYTFYAGTIAPRLVYGGAYSLFDSVTPEEALELINENPESDGYIDAEKLAAAAVMAEKDDDDEANVEAYLEAARTARLEKALQGTTETTQTTNGGGDGQTGDEPEVRDTNYSSSFKKATEQGSDALSSLGGGLSSIFEGAFPNSGISQALSGVFNWTSNTFSDLKNNKIQNGTGILGYGIAAIASFMILPKIGDRLGFLNFGGLTTLLLGFLAIGYGGRFTKGLFEGQGVGNAVPNSIKNLSGDSDDNKQSTPETKTVVKDTFVTKTGDGDEVYLSDEDGDGKKEVKLKDIQINTVAGQGNGNVNTPSMMKIVTGVAANDAEAYLNDLERRGRVVHAREMGKFAGADNFEGGAEAIDIKTGQVISLHSLTGKIDDPNLIAVEHREAG